MFNTFTYTGSSPVRSTSLLKIFTYFAFSSTAKETIIESPFTFKAGLFPSSLTSLQEINENTNAHKHKNLRVIFLIFFFI